MGMHYLLNRAWRMDFLIPGMFEWTNVNLWTVGLLCDKRYVDINYILRIFI